MKKSFCTVSDCLEHASFVIWAHLEPILRRVNDNSQIDTVHFVSDGPSGQYKNRYNMYLLSKLMPGICPNVKCCKWNFTEAGHGKGPMDDVGGKLKSTADKHVGFRKDVLILDDFVRILNEACPGISLTQVTAEDIYAKKAIDTKNAKAIPKITQMHQAVRKKDCPQKIYIRSLSCIYCKEICKHFILDKGFALIEVQKQWLNEKKTPRNLYQQSAKNLLESIS